MGGQIGGAFFPSPPSPLPPVRSAKFEIRRISSICYRLFTVATKKYFLCFCSFTPYYCNSLLSGCPRYLINKLKNIQNNAARPVQSVLKIDHIFPYLVSLHWLPTDLRIQSNSNVQLSCAHQRPERSHDTY